MQPTNNANITHAVGSEGVSISRRPPDLEDYIDMARRHRAWILAPTFLGLVISVVTAFFWPDTYISQASIRVVPPSVPSRYVEPNVSNSEVTQRINSMAQTIMSRAALTNIIQTLNLYPRQRRTMPMEDVIEIMRKDIGLGAPRTLQRSGTPYHPSAFDVSFSYENRFLAQRVTSDLVTRFIDENVRERSSQSIMTTQFLKDQWDDAKHSLDDIEKKIAGYRSANADRMPEAAQANLQQVNAIETQVNSVQNSMSRASVDKMRLETQLEQLKKDLRAAQTPPEELAAASEKNQRLAEIDHDLDNLHLALSTMRERYSDDHPDVKRLEAQIAMLEGNRAALLARQNKTVATAPPKRYRADPGTVREARQIEANISRTAAEIQIRDQEMRDLNKQAAELSNQLKMYQAKLREGTISDGQYALLLQDLDLAKARYDDLDRKKDQSELATDLENRKQSETLELLDPASLPQSPVAPKRGVIIGVGLAIGLIVGFSLAGAREMKDTTLKNLKDVRAYTQLSVLASIPLLENDLVVRRRNRLHWLAWSAGLLAGIVIMAGSVLYYISTRT